MDIQLLTVITNVNHLQVGVACSLAGSLFSTPTLVLIAVWPRRYALGVQSSQFQSG